MSLIQHAVSARDELIDRVTTGLSADTRIHAVWLGGSMGRGEADVLSDVDLAIVIVPGREVAADRFDILVRFGDVALTLDSPQNSHPNGAQVNALYDSLPLHQLAV